MHPQSTCVSVCYRLTAAFMCLRKVTVILSFGQLIQYSTLKHDAAWPIPVDSHTKIVTCVRIYICDCTEGGVFLVLQKKREREGAVLKNSSFTEEQRKKWLGVMKRDYMSSEESGDDDFIVLHSLPWHSDYVSY